MTDATQSHHPGEPMADSRTAPPAFERSISPIAGRLGSGMAGKGVVLAALVAGCGVFVAASWGQDQPKSAPKRDEPARQVVPFEPALKSSSPTLAAPRADAPNLGPTDSGGSVPALQPGAGDSGAAAAMASSRQAEVSAIRGAPILAYSRGGGGGVGPAVPTILATQNGPVREATELDQLRRGSSIGQARAARLPDRNFLIVAGANIPCLLQTAMDTTTPGYVTCLIPRDVLSDNGAVVLMEKGTKVLGEYRSSLRQGQRRLFVLWTRAVTYRSSSRDRWFEAASLLRSFADRLEEDGLASLEWGYLGKLDARQAWRPDIRSPEGLAELDQRTDAVIEGLMRPLRALTVPDRRAIVCMSFVRMALVHIGDLLDEHPAQADELRSYRDQAIQTAVGSE